MSRKSVEREIRDIQARSRTLAAEDAPPLSSFTPAHATTTLAVRLITSDAERVAALAAQQGQPVSSLLRTWILAGLAKETEASVDDAFSEIEGALRRIRQSLASDGRSSRAARRPRKR